jgi:putative ABC transport system substrate-binding protein
VIDRRTFLCGLTLGTLSLPLAGEAQQTGKVYRVGLTFTTSPVSEMAGPEPVHPLARAFVRGLRALGYVEGQNLILERRSAEGRYERFGDIVAELVRLKADVIVTVADPMVRAAKAVTTTVPIVMATSGDPVGEGFVQSLARPGGNITGFTIRAGPEIGAKRLELLRDALPGVSRIAYFASKEDKEWEGPFGKSVRAAAQADALFVGTAGGPVYADRGLIVDFATRTRLPSTFPFREAVELGGLMSYGVSLTDVFRRAAGQVDKILKGAKPADLPIEQPTKFELVINLKTAKALGLTIPQSLLIRADEVVQ